MFHQTWTNNKQHFKILCSKSSEAIQLYNLICRSVWLYFQSIICIEPNFLIWKVKMEISIFLWLRKWIKGKLSLNLLHDHKTILSSPFLFWLSSLETMQGPYPNRVLSLQGSCNINLNQLLPSLKLIRLSLIPFPFISKCI